MRVNGYENADAAAVMRTGLDQEARRHATDRADNRQRFLLSGHGHGRGHLHPGKLGADGVAKLDAVIVGDNDLADHERVEHFGTRRRQKGGRTEHGRRILDAPQCADDAGHSRFRLAGHLIEFCAQFLVFAPPDIAVEQEVDGEDGGKGRHRRDDQRDLRHTKFHGAVSGAPGGFRKPSGEPLTSL